MSLNFTMLWMLEDRLKHTRDKKRASNRNTSKKLPSKAQALTLQHISTVV